MSQGFPGSIRLEEQASEHIDNVESREIARLWVTNFGGATVFVNPLVLPPAQFGMLLAQTLRHAAAHYVDWDGLDERAVIGVMLGGFENELLDPNDIETLAGGGLN